MQHNLVYQNTSPKFEPWQYWHVRQLHRGMWHLRRILLNEFTLICHLFGETVLLLAQWYCAILQDGDADDRWFRTARRVFSVHPHLKRDGLSVHLVEERALGRYGRRDAVCVCAGVFRCAVATCVVDLLRSYHAVPPARLAVR